MNMHATKIEAATKPKVIPQGEDETGELVAIRKLLRVGRSDEALSRLETLMDRHHGSWRTLA